MISRYSRPDMAALWSDETKYSLWLEIETAALEVLIEQGQAPKEALHAVKTKATFDPKRIDELERTLKHDVIAFLTNISESVGEHARWLHWGMTSSDLLDTAFSLQLVRASNIILADIDSLLASLKKRAIEHQLTPCVGRSHGIHAEPMSFGLKFASFYAELSRQRARVAQATADMAVGAFSGPVGTFSHLTPSYEESVCKKLGLKADPVSTQVISRDRHAALFLSFAGVAATAERIVLEVRHLQRTEVREAEEFFSAGQKGSSAMPHKRNPVLSENVAGLSRYVRHLAQSALDNIPLWHERDISHSSVERMMAPDITASLDFLLHRTAGIVEKLICYPENMGRNLELTNGLVFSGTLLVELAAKGLAREEAYALVQRHALQVWEEWNRGETGPSFRARVEGDAEIRSHLSAEEIEAAFSLERHLKHTQAIYQRVFS